MEVTIEAGWKAVLKEEFEKPYFKNLVEFVKSELQIKKPATDLLTVPLLVIAPPALNCIFPVPRSIVLVDGIEKTTLGSAIMGDYFNKTLGAI